ncbi:Oidioi.mRNA.OKI2018_I69.XSR.g15731.t1.cds [Oikopleura dioica]|uniref:Oidioi.mRNA.OKI2018_I69.XSR.g15731.t1.cds n=1 Tax=Oikopleura dioica TaxID=34765 RepID=A0ABN7SEA2_OIKDI|nr:Oidioi.mRNA.OKI2018_I69.XSR.g15731.t1.cds [Oikopleura dioica]
MLDDSDIEESESNASHGKNDHKEADSKFVHRSDLNVTSDAIHPRVVVYNRVPKCGSQTMSMLVNQLSRKNGFLSKAVFEAGETPDRTISQQKSFMNELKNYAKDQPVMYTRHQYFIDFDQFEWAEPVYINLIRDPVDRFASFYYFSRFGNKRAQDAGRSKQQVPSNILNESIDDCITGRRRECTEPIWHTVPYICGNDRSCLQRHESSVQQAKQNIDSKYVVVGILEELKGSLGVFEKVLPDFFAGAVNHLSQIRNDTYTVNKKQMTDAAREYLANETALKLEYDLYNHARARLYEQMRRLNISPSS